MPTTSAIVLNSVLDQIGVLAAVGQHYSIKLLEAQLAGIQFVKASVEQIYVIVGELLEAKPLLQAIFQVILADSPDPPQVQHLESVHYVEVRFQGELNLR